MLTKSQIEHLKKLNRKKYRNESKEFLVEGKRLVDEGLKSNFTCEKVIISNNYNLEESLFFKKHHLSEEKIFTISEKDFNKFSQTKTPQGIAAVFKIPETSKKNISDKLIICLEDISDPGNVGTILRSCDWFGIGTVILSENCADIYNPKVTRASMGAIFNLSIIHSSDFIQSLSNMKQDGFDLYVADMAGKNYREVELDKKAAIIFANEAFGPSEQIKNIADNRITIPKKGRIESLNVAAAAVVIISELSS